MVKRREGKPVSFYFNSVLIILAVVVVAFFLFYPSAGTKVNNYFSAATGSSTSSSLLGNQPSESNDGGSSGGSYDSGSGETPSVAGSSGGGSSGGGGTGNAGAVANDASVDAPENEEPTFDCGNGIYEFGEACDNGGGSGDGCSNNCQIENGWVCFAFPGEASECIIDDSGGVQGETEGAEDIIPAGDPVLNQNQGVKAEGGGSGGSTICGDGTQVVPQEQCDDGNAITELCPYNFNEKACTVCGSSCTIVSGTMRYCGDGIVNGNEACDDGNDCEEDSCFADCTLNLGSSGGHCVPDNPQEAFFVPLFQKFPFAFGAPHAVLSGENEAASNGLIIPVLIVIVLLVVWFARSKPGVTNSVFSFKIF